VSLVLAAVAPEHVLLLAVALFAVGLAGVACRRNVLIMLLSIEIQLNAANLALVAFSKVHGDVSGQTFVFFAMTVAAAEVAVGLAIVIALFRIRREADADAASDLRERDLGPLPPIVPEGTPDPHAHDEHAPHPAGPEAHPAPHEPEPAHAGAHAHAHGGGGHA
jgi:NADH-quinone oxidoreductase subunit K